MMRRGPSADDLLNTLVAQLDILRARLQAWSLHDWEQRCEPSGDTACAVIRGLAEELAECRLLPFEGVTDLVPLDPEWNGFRAAPTEYIELLKFLEQAGEHAVAVLAAATSSALPAPRAGQGQTVGLGEGAWPPLRATAMLLADVVVRRWDIPSPGDRGPDPRAARLLLQSLFPAVDDPAVSPAVLLLHLAGRVRLVERTDWPPAPWALRLARSQAVAGER